MKFNIQFDRENDGRWIGEIPEIPGAIVYGETHEDAEERINGLALRVIMDKEEN